ncbi:hypothetical protein QJQ45_029518 [Haematococcus lacustris]|nr:hypothetical protein QJQ45_029518 [Haematococcus lacustris]
MVMANGSAKVVPAPATRDQLVLNMHGSNGHFGVRRTTAMLLHNHWWAGIHADVARILKSCHVCDRARASFNLRAAQLSPLPVQGLFYRWGVDLAGPLPRTHRGNEYLMVCIEHLTKHVELVPIPDKLATTTAYNFHHQVLGRFGASAEVLTDGGREFQGEFAELLQRHLIDHRVTSPHHPQADGLAERAVQTFKDALCKHIAVSGDPAAWDEALPAIALGYRVSPQEATKCSPYSLLYGRAPVLPPAVVQRMARPVNLDEPVVAAHDLLERSAVLSRETAAAMGNIRIAQHRDTLRYATTHSGSYKPAARQLHPGSFVWTQRPPANTLQLGARPEIYRVVSVGANGVARLMGKCGRVMAENVCNLAPCHLPDIDPTIDHTLARPTADFPCSICKSPTDADRMLLCDGCGCGYHMFCLTPKLTFVPEGTWLPLCGEADSATHLLSGCSETLPLVQERHNGAGRLIVKAISKGTLGGYIRFADTGSWEKGAKEDLDLPNDTLHTTLRSLGLKTAATKHTTRPDILMVTPQAKAGNRGKVTKRRRTQAVATQPAAPPLHEVFTTKPGRDRAAAAQRLHGRVVRHTGTGLWGVLRFKGQQFHPRFFAVDWVDGTTTDAMSPTILRNRQWLQPEGTTLPATPPHGVQPSRRRSTRLGPTPGALNPGRLGRRNPRLSQAKWSARHMSSMSVDGSSYAADAAGSVNGPTIGSRFSPSAPPVKHPLPSSGTVLLPYELDRSFQCVQSSLQVLCNDAELWGGSALQLVLRKLPSRASAAFSDGFVKPSVVQEYQRRYEELPSDQAWDADYCIAMFLDIVRDDLSDPVLLKQHVQGVQLGDVGDSGRTEAPRSLKARMAPQLVRMAEEGHLSRLCAVNLFLHALMPHPRHVLHSQGQHLVQRSKVTYARLPKPPHSQDSVELALGRAEAAATQVYEELIGMLQLEQAAALRQISNSIFEIQSLGLAQPSPAQPSPAQPSPAQPSPAQPSPAQPSPAQPSPAQPSPAQPSPAQPSPAQPYSPTLHFLLSHSTAECHLLKQQQPQAAPAPTPAHPHSHGAAASSQPIDPALYEQFRLFMASRSPAAALPLRAHTVVQSRSGPSRGRPRCDHCGKDGHTEERCFSKHPELRPAQWGQPGPAHSLAAVPGVGEGEGEDEDEDAALHSLTNMPITSVSTAFDAMRHAIALAAAAERPLSFAPNSATTHALPASRAATRDTSSSSSSSSSKVPMQLEGQADITDTVRTLVQQSAALAAAGPAQPASSLRALPFAANPSVCACLSVLDRHGTPHALPGVMLDSGSGAQLITASLARQLKLEVLPSQQRIIQSGGTAFQTQGAAVVEVGLALGTPYAARSRHRFQVVADSTSLPYDLLVGNEILFRHGIQLDLVGRLLSYAPRLFSHNEAQPRHALPMYFEPPAEWSSGQLLSQSSVIATSLVASPDPVTNAHPTPPAQLSALQPYTQDAVSESGSSGCAESSAAAPVIEAATGPSNWAAIPAAYPASLMSYALPYAANLSVATGLSIIDRHGHPHAVPGVVLDSGSGAHLIAPWLVERLELQADHMRLRIFQSGGTAFHAHGGVMAEVGLALGTPHAARSRHRFHVMPANSLPFSLLLGTEVLYQHGIQLDLTARHLTYAPSLASHGRQQPRHALPLRFNARDAWPGLSSMVETSLAAHPEPTSPEPLWACVTSPAHSEGEHGSGGHTGVSYLGAPGAQSSATSAAPGCSHAPSVAEDTSRPEIRGLVWEPRSKPGHGTDRPQLPARSPKHQALGLGAARRRARQQLRTTPPPKGTSWATAGHQLLTTIRKGCTLRTITTLLLILCALLPTLHACPPNELPAVPALPDAYCSVTIEHTLPGGRQHLPPDVRFTKHAKGMLFGNHPGMTTAEHAALQALVEDHDSAFSYSLSDLPGYHGPRPPFSIPLTSDQPVRTPPRRYSPLERQVCIDKTAELQAAGIVSPVEGPCSYAAAPVLPAKKDAHGNWTEKRFASDYRQLNAATKPDIYGLPRPDEMFSELGDSCYFSKLDMRSGFFQLIIAPADRIKTAFWCGNKLYHFNRMPFGLRNAPAEYQRVMDRCIADAGLTHCCKAYIDDLLIHSTSTEQHLADVAAALRMLQANGLKAHPDKSLFGADVVEYLGHNVSSHGLSPTEAKVAAVTALPTPTCLHDLRQIMGFINYYRCYVPDFSAIAAPITRLTSKGVSWVWGEEQQQAFATLKAAICTPGLVLRRADPDRPFTLHTDWSTAGCGAVLGHPFTLRGNLQDYTFTIEHRPGNKHQNADVLSRWPLATTADGSGAQLDPDPAVALACFPCVATTQAESMVWSCASYWPFDSHYATHPADLLWGNLGGHLDASFHPSAPPLPEPTEPALHDAALTMLQQAAPTLAHLQPAVTFRGAAAGPRDMHGVAPPTRLDTTLIPTTFFPAAANGIVLLELFGGLCAGLDMCLRNGVTVCRYLYCDTNPAAQRVAQHRLSALSTQYPTLLPASAYATAFTSLPSDVRTITTSHLVGAGAMAGQQWLVVAGWECQDLSSAGTQAGMHGPHSSTHHDCLRIIGSMQQLQPSCPPGYILENVAVQHNLSSPAVAAQLQPLCQLFGEPLCFDAAIVGSYAHRVRNYWTNLCDTAAVAAVLAHADRGHAQVQDILDPGRRAPLAAPLCVLPTLVATPPYAFRNAGPGLMINPDGTCSEPTVPERERALDYGTGATAAPGVSLPQRFAILGRCMDAFAMQSLLATSLALFRSPPSPSLTSCACVAGGSVGPKPLSRHPAPVGSLASPTCLEAAVVAAAEEGSDIHTDAAALHYLRNTAHLPGLTATEMRRVVRRAKAYRYEADQLLRVMANGSAKVVPAPATRDQLVLNMHGSNGHFGVRRTTAMLLHNHWWAGIHADVARILKSCHVCDRARASFNLRAAQLSPLPVQGLFYRWGVDLAGPLPRTHRGNEYLMVCIEHLTKHVELVPIPDKLATTTAYNFHHQVLGRFGASAEVLTDGGREFQGEFAELLQRHLIDHRVTSPHHPQADGLAERAVQTFKDVLRKHIAVSGDPAAWDEALPAIALGYRVSPQEATKCSPYSLLYGRAPVLPPAVVQRMARPVNLDEPVVAAHDLLERSAVLSRETAAAMGNIRIAQHRDTLRYATTHSGSYKPAARQLHPGSFVWTQRPPANTLQLGARPEIYRVVSVGANGRRTQAVATQPAAPPLHEVFTTKPGRDRAAAAQRLHGRVVRHTGTGLWGVLRFKGQQFHPRFFAVEWVDGTTTDAMSPTILRNRQWLQPEGTTLPATPPHGVQPSRRRSTRLGPSGDNAVLATMATINTGLISMASLWA